MKSIMIDAETLGTTADAVILSIGAVKFDLEAGHIDNLGFYRSVSVESNLDHNRRISESTLLWWFGQDADAQAVFREAKVTLPDALTEFSDWIGSDRVYPWSNGADFDLPMLVHAFTQVKMEIPWQFRHSRCYRTYKNLPGAKNIRVPQTGVKHNALDDAFTQAQTVCAIHKALFSKETNFVNN